MAAACHGPARGDERRDEALHGLREEACPQQPRAKQRQAKPAEGRWLPGALDGWCEAGTRGDLDLLPAAVGGQGEEAGDAEAEEGEVGEHDHAADLPGAHAARHEEEMRRSSWRQQKATAQRTPSTNAAEIMARHAARGWGHAHL